MNTVLNGLTLCDSPMSLETGHTVIGHVTEVLDHARLRVRLPVMGAEFVSASCLEHVAARNGGLASLVGRQVLLTCVGGDLHQSVVCGVILRDVAAPPDAGTRAASPQAQVATLDGKRVVLEASQEIVLKCGKGSLTLTADGRIVMKGVEVVSRALRTNKIKGGAVHIN